MVFVFQVFVHARYANNLLIGFAIKIQLIFMITTYRRIPQKSHQILYIVFSFFNTLHWEQLVVGKVEIIMDRLQGLDDKIGLSALIFYCLFHWLVLFEVLSRFVGWLPRIYEFFNLLRTADKANDAFWRSFPSISLILCGFGPNDHPWKLMIKLFTIDFINTYCWFYYLTEAIN